MQARAGPASAMWCSTMCGIAFTCWCASPRTPSAAGTSWSFAMRSLGLTRAMRLQTMAPRQVCSSIVENPARRAVSCRRPPRLFHRAIFVLSQQSKRSSARWAACGAAVRCPGVHPGHHVSRGVCCTGWRCYSSASAHDASRSMMGRFCGQAPSHWPQAMHAEARPAPSAETARS